MGSTPQGFNEDVADTRLLGKLKEWEWTHFRKKCRSVSLEDLFWRYIERVAKTNALIFIYTIELILGTHIIILFILVPNQSLYVFLPDLVTMFLAPIVMWVTFKEPVEVEHYYTMNIIASCAMALMLVTMDSFVKCLKGAFYPLLPSYDHIVISSIYLFLPIGFLDNSKPYLLGIFVSIVYMIYMICVLKKKSPLRLATLIEYAIYMTYLNIVFMFSRVLTEFNLRRKILTRFQSLRENILLKLVLKSEKKMLDTILPSKIARSLQDDIRTRIEDERLHGSSVMFTLPRKLFVEPHPEVSILIADMVNYTHLTTTLDVKDLVEILHELFVAFDRSAERFNVLRIKFLGDAYYCVAGIPIFMPNHASSCLDLALEMINATRESRERRQLSIDMRIGVHSGEVFSGILGRTKWAFDIWSKDVDITARLEASGMPGMVHISERTLNLLDNQYYFEEGSTKALDDPILQNDQIKTYLVTGRVNDAEAATDSDSADDSLSNFSFRASIVDDALLSNVYEEVRQDAQNGMKDEVENMPVGITYILRNLMCCVKGPNQSEDFLLNADISNILVLFRNGTTEWNYMNQPDHLIKYSIFTLLLAGIALFMMGFCLPIIPMEKYIGSIILLSMLTIVCLVANYKKIWLQFLPLSLFSQPKFFLSRLLMRLSQLLEDQLLARMLVSVFGIFLVYSISAIGMISCNIAEFELELIVSDLNDETPEVICFLPWVITHGIIVTLSVIPLFFGLSLIFKICLAILIVVSHIVTIEANYGFAFERSETTNVGLKAGDAHILYVLIFFLLIMIKERHVTYMNKVDYYVKLRYEEKHSMTLATTHSIRIIMANILPSHVANDFIERRRRGELYYENFDKVAVMFATIENYEVDRMGIRLLNEFICHFDDVLRRYTHKYKVEKIKVISWTYMAACGLQVDHYADFSLNVPLRKRSREGDHLRTRSSSVRFDLMAHRSNIARAKNISTPASLSSANPVLEINDEVVLVMTHFAVDLLRIMDKIKTQGVHLEFGSRLKGTLKIGISHGPVMAGIVGLSKPHYDIWGHSVNMASRMTSTSIPGRIQITEVTCKVLRKYGICCDYRGQIYVKGIGIVPTYLLALDSSNNFRHVYFENDSFNGRCEVDPDKASYSVNDSTEIID